MAESRYGVFGAEQVIGYEWRMRRAFVSVSRRSKQNVALLHAPVINAYVRLAKTWVLVHDLDGLGVVWCERWV